MLPYCDRVVSVPRGKYLPSHNRGIPVPKEPTTIGGHLRRRRLELRIFQAEAARRLGVSTVALSRWECDKDHPAWSHQPKIITYLGYDPFDTPALGGPKGNESHFVASLSTGRPTSLGQQIIQLRLERKINRKELAQELGISVKTLWGWEIDRHAPSTLLKRRILELFRIRET